MERDTTTHVAFVKLSNDYELRAHALERAREINADARNRFWAIVLKSFAGYVVARPFNPKDVSDLRLASTIPPHEVNEWMIEVGGA
jgi:hypothetical protein